MVIMCGKRRSIIRHYPRSTVSRMSMRRRWCYRETSDVSMRISTTSRQNFWERGILQKISHFSSSGKSSSWKSLHMASMCAFQISVIRCLLSSSFLIPAKKNLSSLEESPSVYFNLRRSKYEIRIVIKTGKTQSILKKWWKMTVYFLFYKIKSLPLQRLSQVQ